MSRHCEAGKLREILRAEKTKKAGSCVKDGLAKKYYDDQVSWHGLRHGGV